MRPQPLIFKELRRTFFEQDAEVKGHFFLLGTPHQKGKGCHGTPCTRRSGALEDGVDWERGTQLHHETQFIGLGRGDGLTPVLLAIVKPFGLRRYICLRLRYYDVIMKYKYIGEIDCSWMSAYISLLSDIHTCTCNTCIRVNYTPLISFYLLYPKPAMGTNQNISLSSFSDKLSCHVVDTFQLLKTTVRETWSFSS